MTLDEKTCWNPTWIVMDNVGWAYGVFFQAYFKEVGLMKIVRAHGFQNNILNLDLRYFINFYDFLKDKIGGNVWWLLVRPKYNNKKIIFFFFFPEN
jgi:hypothetical protein